MASITLLAYRKSLIHECVTGQRRVSEADVARVTSPYPACGTLSRREKGNSEEFALPSGA